MRIGRLELKVTWHQKVLPLSGFRIKWCRELTNEGLCTLTGWKCDPQTVEEDICSIAQSYLNEKKVKRG